MDAGRMNEMPKHLKDFINFIEYWTNNYKKSDLKVCFSQRQSILQSKNPEFSECQFFHVLFIHCRKKKINSLSSIFLL